ncbi:MAG: hypothetical protein CMG13_05620 [Candidatus Marinimicrobia bacterium]|nr:hypothetical protein [Candidatus Neomarinimicrobiota bacterium]|tara:strand:+ start:412 stop:651 length:240 start_codon:yes stop_codon:yes gene_type:complete
MREFVNFEKNIFPVAVKLLVPAYIIQTLWLIEWDAIEYWGFKAVTYGIIYWLISLVVLRMACEMFLVIFKAFSKYVDKA